MLSRRRFLAAGGGAVALAGLRPHLALAQTDAGVFTHGVASGDPLHDRVVLWTRVTPSPDAVPGSGTGPAVEVEWELAREAGFERVVASGTTTTDAAADHTVHVDADGLAPGTTYWYRFLALGATSPVGRTKTAAAPGQAVACLRLGLATCAEYEFGYYGAYRHLAARDDLDAILHLGDYIYEFGIGYGSPPTATATPGPSIGRAHEPPGECLTLADYRVRYGQYRRDPDLAALHAAHPFIVMYDDHEVANDTWRDGAQNHQEEEGDFATRAAAGRQAWREWLPIRQVDPADPELVHRRFRFGDVAELWMLDERRYRDRQPENAFFSYGSIDPAINDPARTMLGVAQRDWLFEGLRTSTAAWKVLGNPVPFFPFVIGPALASAVTGALAPLQGQPLPPIPPPLTVDDWNGYRAEQQAVIDLLAATPVPDVVVLTGDYHESFVAEIPQRTGDYVADGNSVAVEFVAPSVTSPGLGETLEAGGLPDGRAVEAVFDANLSTSNPWVRYHEGRSKGFGVVELTAERAQYDFWFVDDILDPASGASAASSWQVRRGTAKAVPAAAPLGATCTLPAASAPATTVPPSSATTAGGPGGGLAATGGGVPVGGVAAVAGLGALAGILARRARSTDGPQARRS